MNHRPRKRFGQNFLQNKSIINEIIRALNLHQTNNVVEIGPGLGALTQPLLKRLNRLTAIEIDNDLKSYLTSLPEANEKLTLISADALALDYGQLGAELRVVGNLPYNISTPLLFYLLTFASSIYDMHFMLQKEVVTRLAAKPGTKAYGRLSVMAQYHCEVEPLFDVPPEAFHPQPKINSTVVRLVPHQKSSPYPSVDVNRLKQLVAQAFAMRRKTIANNLKSLFTSAQLHALDVDPLARPEELSIMTYVQLTKFITK